MKTFRIYQRATIQAIYKGDNYLLVLQDMPEHTVHAKPCGKMRKRQITLCIGDEVSVELSPYDLKRGRIRWRHE